MLVEMEIDTGNHPPIASKPYTLPLKHYDWVQKEIETLERAGIIERSISPWATPIVIVPKKSAPGEPPRRRMCIDYRKINKLQPEVTKADGGKGPIGHKTYGQLKPSGIEMHIPPLRCDLFNDCFG